MEMLSSDWCISQWQRRKVRVGGGGGGTRRRPRLLCNGGTRRNPHQHIDAAS